MKRSSFYRIHRSFSSASSLPSSCDVVVVGGGSIGTSTLYHLQKRGLNAVLLERNLLTSGTTWHSAGMLWRLRASDTDIELTAYTRDLLKKLEKETETDCWIENGGLFLAGNKERMDEYKRLAELGKYYNIPSQVLSPSDINAIHPLISVDDCYGGLYSPGDGSIDPAGAVTAYSKAAQKLGALVYENEGVTNIEMEESNHQKSVKAVITSSGQRIETKYIVNACGVWANELAKMVNVKLPLLAMKHAMVVTESLPGMNKTLPNVRDHDLSIYLKTQGDSMSIGGYETNPEFWNQIDPNFSFGLFNLDWDTFGQNLNGHIKVCPSIEKVGIKSTVCGPESFTPDHKPLLGPSPNISGFFNACGANSMGMMLGGGLGLEISNWIIDGTPHMDLFSFDVARFHPDCTRSKQWALERTHESYAKTYAVVFPHDEPLAGRSTTHDESTHATRRSPLYRELLHRGCVYQSRHGFERPGWFISSCSGEQQVKDYDYYGAYEEERGGGWRIHENHPSVPKHESHKYHDIINEELSFEDWGASFEHVAEECYAARNGVALFDQSYFGKFYISSKNSEQADNVMQYLCGTDIKSKPEGSVSYTVLCNERGGVEADLTITKLFDNKGYYISAGGNTMTKDFDWIRKVLYKKFTILTSRGDVEEEGDSLLFQDASADMAILSVQGPYCRELLQPLLMDKNNEPYSLEAKNEVNGEDEFEFSTYKPQLKIDGFPIELILRLTFVGELGYELHIHKDYAEKVYQSIIKQGQILEEEEQQQNMKKKCGDVIVRDAGYRAIDSLSAEKNFRHWHADLSNKDTPFEAGIGFTVLPKLKNCEDDFIGKEALQEARSNGLQRKLICLLLSPQSADEDLPPLLHGNETIWRNGECIGYIKSTAYGHSLGKTIAYGYVDKPTNLKKITNAWLTKEGTVWTIGDKGKQLDAQLSLKAPFDPTNQRIKGIYA